MPAPPPPWMHTPESEACVPLRARKLEKEGGDGAIRSPSSRVAGAAQQGEAAPRLDLPPVTYNDGDGRSPAPEEVRKELQLAIEQSEREAAGAARVAKFQR